MALFCRGTNILTCSAASVSALPHTMKSQGIEDTFSKAEFHNMCRKRSFLQWIFVSSKGKVSQTFQKACWITGVICSQSIQHQSLNWSLASIGTALKTQHNQNCISHRSFLYFLSAAKCNFGFVTVVTTQEFCINLLTLSTTSVFIYFLFSLLMKHRKNSVFFCLSVLHFLINVLFLCRVSVFSALGYRQNTFCLLCGLFFFFF